MSTPFTGLCLTPWFKSHLRPVRPGIYIVRYIGPFGPTINQWFALRWSEHTQAWYSAYSEPDDHEGDLIGADPDNARWYEWRGLMVGPRNQRTQEPTP